MSGESHDKWERMNNEKKKKEKKRLEVKYRQ